MPEATQTDPEDLTEDNPPQFEESWDDPVPNPLPAETDEPEATTTDLRSEQPLPARPSRRGTGLLIGAGIAGAAGIGFNIWRATAYADSCAVAGELERAFGCSIGALGIFPITGMTWMANLGSIGLAAAGGSLRGRYDGISSFHAIADGPNRTGVGAIASGASLVGLGVAAGIGMRAWMFSSMFSGCHDRNDVEQCMRRQVYGYFAGLQLSAMATAAGAGLLAYGVGIRKYGSDRFANLRLSPQFGWSHTGLSLSGTF